MEHGVRWFSFDVNVRFASRVGRYFQITYCYVPGRVKEGIHPVAHGNTYLRKIQSSFAKSSQGFVCLNFAPPNMYLGNIHATPLLEP